MHEKGRIRRHHDQHPPRLNRDHVRKISITPGERHVIPDRENNYNDTQPEAGSGGKPTDPRPRDSEIDQSPSSEKNKRNEYRHEVERADIPDSTPQLGRVPGTPEHDVTEDQQHRTGPERQGRRGQPTADNRRDRQRRQEHPAERPETEKPQMVTDRREPISQAETVRGVAGKETPIPEPQLVIGLKQRKRQSERITRCHGVITEQRGNRDHQPRAEPAQQPPPPATSSSAHRPQHNRAEHQDGVVGPDRGSQPHRQPCRGKRRPAPGPQPP